MIIKFILHSEQLVQCVLHNLSEVTVHLCARSQHESAIENLPGYVVATNAFNTIHSQLVTFIYKWG